MYPHYPTAQAASMVKHKLIANKLFGGLFFSPGIAWKYLRKGCQCPNSDLVPTSCSSYVRAAFVLHGNNCHSRLGTLSLHCASPPELECKWTWIIFKGNHSSVINNKVIMVASDTAGKHLQTLGTGNSLMRAKLYQTAHGLWGLKALASGVSMTSGLAWKLLLFRKYW